MEHNNNNNMTDSGPENDEFTDSEDLLNSLTYGIRKFYFSGTWDDIILGVILEETIDSFLIGMPAKLSTKGNTHTLEEMTEVPYMRFLKSEFRAVSFIAGIQEKMYREYLEIKSPELFPDLLEMIGEVEIDEEGDAVRVSDEPTYDEIGELIPKEEVTIQTPEGIIVRGNITDTELKNTVEDALKEGRFLPPQGKLPN